MQGLRWCFPSPAPHGQQGEEQVCLLIFYLEPWATGLPAPSSSFPEPTLPSNPDLPPPPPDLVNQLLFSVLGRGALRLGWGDRLLGPLTMGLGPCDTGELLP